MTTNLFYFVNSLNPGTIRNKYSDTLNACCYKFTSFFFWLVEKFGRNHSCVEFISVSTITF